MKNSHEPERPDADAMLAAIKMQRKRRKGGKLHLYLGMAPGVGKTYAMLLAGQEAKNEGQDVVIGVVETHGRVETQALLKDIEIVASRKIEYRGIYFEEMDLDAILLRKPKIVLVDELAHSNIPGSRHAKRWQDVFELLDAGIDVYSSLNVQHLESRKESVEQIAGIRVHETVPDSVLDRAFQIRLIDLSPGDLLKRLKEGKVYLGERAELASKNFFQEEKLTALREIALRLAAEKVDTELQTFAASREAGTPWKTVERLLVAVDHKQSMQELIRSTRRLAFNLEGPWLAVYVDTGRLLSQKDQTQLASNLELARSLGAEVITLSDTRIAEALLRIAKQRNVTRVVLGKSKKHWFRNTLRELVYEQDEIDILVQGHHHNESEANSFLQGLLARQAFVSDYFKTAVVMFVLSFPAVFFGSGWIYWVGLAWLCLSSSLGPLMLGAGLATVVAHYMQFEQAVWNSVCYFALAFVGGILNSRIKLNRDLLNAREERSSLLFEIIRDILAGSSREEMLNAVEVRVGQFLQGECTICLLKKDSSFKPVLQDAELGVAKWVLENQKAAGWLTETIPGASALYLPLQGHLETLGVFIFKPKDPDRFLAEPDRNWLDTVCNQLGFALEKELFRERARDAERLQEASQVHKSILNFMSDELRSPLSVMVQAVTILLDKDLDIQESRKEEMLSHLLNSSEKLGVVIDNLLTISRLSIGIFPLKRMECSAHQLVYAALEQLKRTLAHHPVEVSEAPDLPNLSVDFTLCEQAIANILLNAVQYTPGGMPIRITMKQINHEIHIGIEDGGPGIPEDYLGRIFDKFYRYPGSQGQGAGIGLAVAKGVIRAHEGKIVVTNHPPRGAHVTVIFPLNSLRSPERLHPQNEPLNS